jgi:hypothetical protein
MYPSFFLVVLLGQTISIMPQPKEAMDICVMISEAGSFQQGEPLKHSYSEDTVCFGSPSLTQSYHIPF